MRHRIPLAESAGGRAWAAGTALFLTMLLSAGCASGASPSTAQLLPTRTTTLAPQPSPTDTYALPDPWIPLRSTSAADILAAAKKSTLLCLPAPGLGDSPGPLTNLGTPILVLGLHTARYPDTADYYEIPNLDAKGQTTDIVTAALNPAHTAIHVASITEPEHPLPNGTIAHQSVSNAVAALDQQRGISICAGTAPVLVYIPIDAALLETGQVTWIGGGGGPMDPVWLMHGANGIDYVYGSDGKVYALSEIPGNPHFP